MCLQSSVGQQANFVTGIGRDQVTRKSLHTAGRTPSNSQERCASGSPSALLNPVIVECVSEETRYSLISPIGTCLPTHKGGEQLGVGHMMVSRVSAEARTCMQKSRGGRSAKLMMTDRWWLVHMVTLGRADSTIH